MNIQRKKFLFRPLTSIHLSYDITGPITKCHIDSFGLKSVYLCIFNVFSVILKFSLKFVNIQIR